MHEKIAILYPSIAMALLTLSLVFGLGARRFLAVRNRTVSVKYYTTFSEGGGEPEGLRKHTRHVLNHFEAPPLFHFAVFGTYLVGDVTATTLVAAWFFVGARCVHSLIHLGYNNVLHRFLVYGAGLIAVAFLWICLLFAVSAHTA